MNTVTFTRADGTAKNSYTDWGLLLRPKNIAPPEPKIITMAIDGRDGDIDLTEWAGAVRYNDRAFPLAFYMTDAATDINAKATTIKNWLHGQRVKITFSDDADYYYSARVSVTAAYNDGGVGMLSMDVIAAPYKYKQEKTLVKRTIDTSEYIVLQNDRMLSRPKITAGAAFNIVQYSKNLIAPNFSTSTLAGVTYTADGAGGVTVNGTATGMSYITFSTRTLPAGVYTISGFPLDGSPTKYGGLANAPNLSVSYYAYSGSRTFTLETAQSVHIRFRVFEGATVSGLYFKPQLEAGDTATAWEAHKTTSYNVSAGTYEYTNFLLREGLNVVGVAGSGEISFEWQEGAL